MSLRPIAQLHHSGCFIASVAMLLGKSYDDAFHLLHPGQKTWMLPDHGFLEASVEEAAHRLLRNLG